MGDKPLDAPRVPASEESGTFSGTERSSEEPVYQDEFSMPALSRASYGSYVGSVHINGEWILAIRSQRFVNPREMENALFECAIVRHEDRADVHPSFNRLDGYLLRGSQIHWLFDAAKQMNKDGKVSDHVVRVFNKKYDDMQRKELEDC